MRAALLLLAVLLAALSAAASGQRQLRTKRNAARTRTTAKTANPKPASSAPTATAADKLAVTSVSLALFPPPEK